MTGRGSKGNVIAALCSFFIPGLGQLLQGRVLAAAFFFLINVVTAASMYVLIGFVLWPICWIWNILNAARWRG